MRLPGTGPVTGPGGAAEHLIPGVPEPPGDAAPCGVAGRRGGLRAGLRSDRGQTAIEFTGTLPLILVTLALLWQGAVIGYTFMLAGNAADKAVTAATSTYGSRKVACEKAGREDLPSAWVADFDCGVTPGGDLVKATVDVKVPLFFPGAFNLPMTLTGEAAANVERPGPW
ncbi:pilus assembly protein [Streptomyces sp. NPDC059499]|uniref:pilus assembly protein n=1 Tax=Streptomyces sp. NPDC059499 TaxID=3346852 RepID=UPI0036763D49